MKLQSSPLQSKQHLGKGCGCLLILLLLPLLYFGLYFAFWGTRPINQQLIAHRGGPAQAPENTMAAFEQAVSIGADWLELDVQMTKDGALVVIHDETVDRTTNGVGRVGALTLAQIRTLDAGNGEVVPTFEEVIALAKASGVGLMPEAKSPHLYPGLEAKMVQAIEAAGYEDNTIVQSFDPTALETFYALNPELRLCALYRPGQLWLEPSQPGQAAYVCPMAEMVLLNPWLLRQAHAQGKPAFVWFGVIEQPLVMRLLLALGVDGLMVDNPVALAEILD